MPRDFASPSAGLANTYAGSNVVVTGGAGFVGSHLTERLLELGATVAVVDDLCTGTTTNLDTFRDHHSLRVYRSDIAEWASPEGPLDFVFNLACPASPVHYRRLALETLRAGSSGAERMVRLAADRGAVFVQASTSEVYGDPEEHPQTEGYWGRVNPVGPRSMYDESKRFTEALCAEWERQGAKIRVARIFNTYGPRMAMHDGRVVPNFVLQALSGEDLTIYGDGSQTRSFCFVSDLVEGLLRLGASDVRGPTNLGNPYEEYTVADFAALVLELTGSRSRVVREGLPVDDPVRRRPDITRARELLGWEPAVSLRDGLAATIASFRPRVESALTH